jgi:tetratricopeptide (TPR) repeat protein
LRDAVRVDPDSAWARRALAAAYEKLGRFGDAEMTYEEGVAREGLGSPITLAYDDYLKRRAEDGARRRGLEAALKRDPANATLYGRLGELALAAGEAEKGINLLSAAVTLEPASPGANAALGFYYRTHGRAAAAVPYLERARAAAPGTAPYRILLADAYVETGRYRDALAELDAVDEPAHLAKAFALRAKAYHNLGDREAASAAARRALELSPALAEAKEFVAE